MRVSIIIPTLDEARVLPGTLERLSRLEGIAELLVVDAGSSDGTADIAESNGAVLLRSPKRQRAAQMNLGAGAATGDVFLFLHADTLLPATALTQIAAACVRPEVVGGAFVRTFNSPSRFLAFTTRLAAARNRAFGWHLGDQALFARRSAFETLGGFPDYDRFEDLDFSRRLGRLGRLATLHPGVVTSARRFQSRGPFRTTLRDLWLTFRYWSGDRRVCCHQAAPMRPNSTPGL